MNTNDKGTHSFDSFCDKSSGKGECGVELRVGPIYDKEYCREILITLGNYSSGLNGGESGQRCWRILIVYFFARAGGENIWKVQESH